MTNLPGRALSMNGQMLESAKQVPPSPSGDRLRRAEDHVPSLLVASGDLPPEPTRAGGSIEVRGVRILGEAGFVSMSEAAAATDPCSLLIDMMGDEAVLVLGSHIRWLPRGDGGDELLQRAARGAESWKREQVRRFRRESLAEHLITFAERLANASTPGDVYLGLAESCCAVVGGYTAMVFLRDAGTDTLRLESSKLLSGLTIEVPRSSCRPALFTREDTCAEIGAPFASLEPIFDATGAAKLAVHPLDDEGLLVLVERRLERPFEPEDWELFRALTRQATGALERIRLLKEVVDLSLTDPLTGLANRRHLHITLGQSIALAQRGEPLTLVMIDVDGLKAINDSRGHLAGDRALCLLADALRREARAADLVSRFGGDEFLVLLPGGDDAGAEALLRRVRTRLGKRVEFTAGVASYHTAIRTADQLIDEADQKLYDRRNDLRWHRKSRSRDS